jgi:hypothetical protein
MAKLVNRAKMTTATTGTGTITLGSAVAGYQSFADAGVVNGDVVRYVIEDGSDWEIGTGTYTSSGTALSRTVDESSNADAAINLSGTATVFVSAVAADVVTPTATQTLANKTAEKLMLNDGYTEEVFAISDGSTVNLDPNNGSIQTWTLGANRTPGQANWAAGQSITLLVDDGTARTITWSTLAVVWKTDGGTAPTLETTGFTVIVLWKVGTTIYGARVGDA